MEDNRKDGIKTIVSAAAGAGIGAGIYGTIGGMGLAVGGTAIGITRDHFWQSEPE